MYLYLHNCIYSNTFQIYFLRLISEIRCSNLYLTFLHLSMNSKSLKIREKGYVRRGTMDDSTKRERYGCTKMAARRHRYSRRAGPTSDWYSRGEPQKFVRTISGQGIGRKSRRFEHRLVRSCFNRRSEKST